MPDIRRDWPRKWPGDHTDASGYWRNADGELITIEVLHGTVIDVPGPVIFSGSSGPFWAARQNED